jgi:integrase
MFTLACEQGLINDSPMRWVKKLKEAEPRRRSLTGEQKEKLWHTLATQPDTLLFRLVILAVNSPLRRGQLIAISPDAIDWQNGLLYAVASKRKGPRPIPLNSTALSTLRLMVADSQLPLPITDIRKRWRKVLIEAGINKEGGSREENFHFHDLRTMFGSELKKRGVDNYYIQQLFAHSDMETSTIYLTSELPKLVEAVKKLDDVQEMEGMQ